MFSFDVNRVITTNNDKVKMFTIKPSMLWLLFLFCFSLLCFLPIVSLQCKLKRDGG